MVNGQWSMAGFHWQLPIINSQLAINLFSFKINHGQKKLLIVNG
jgi:hypothetical protein